jgi:branched-chain amino acid transport system permease protein
LPATAVEIETAHYDNKEIKKSFLVSLWFMFLTFPIMVIKVNTIEQTIEWRWGGPALRGAGQFRAFLFVALWPWRARSREEESGSQGEEKIP